MEYTGPAQFCPPNGISSLLEAMRTNARQGSRELDGLLLEYPSDARLHFLKGSSLAEEGGDIQAARAAMQRAVDLAPDHVMTRFQFGFHLLAWGEVGAAQEIWRPLLSLPDAHYVHHLVKGLYHLINEEIEEALRLLQSGIAGNNENQPTNRDMQLIVDAVVDRLHYGRMREAPASSVDSLLQQAALKPKS